MARTIIDAMSAQAIRIKDAIVVDPEPLALRPIDTQMWAIFDAASGLKSGDTAAAFRAVMRPGSRLELSSYGRADSRPGAARAIDDVLELDRATPRLAPAAYRIRVDATADAVTFLAGLSDDIVRPTVSGSEDGEIVLDWRVGGGRAVLEFEGNGRFGYALLANGRFVPGAHEGMAGGPCPGDLLGYLRGA